MGSVCAVMGVVMVALPISVISSTFNEKFREHNQGIQVRARREEQKRVLTSKLRAMFFSTQGRTWGSKKVLSSVSECSVCRGEGTGRVLSAGLGRKGVDTCTPMSQFASHAC